MPDKTDNWAGENPTVPLVHQPSCQSCLAEILSPIIFKKYPVIILILNIWKTEKALFLVIQVEDVLSAGFACLLLCKYVNIQCFDLGFPV